jgi:hypothetical protein
MLDISKVYSTLGVGGWQTLAQCCAECTVFSYVNDIALYLPITILRETVLMPSVRVNTYKPGVRL